jgi:DNA ligase (NAD+)
MHLENLEMVIALRNAGVQFELSAAETQLASDKLAGKSIVVSGVFSVPRDEIKRLIEQNGGKNVSSISKNTNFVLAGEKMGPEKRNKAQKLNIPIISEEEFYQMI